MDAKLIIPVIGAVFLVLALARVTKDRWRLQPASKAWFLLGSIFSVVSAWLWLH